MFSLIKQEFDWNKDKILSHRKEMIDLLSDNM